MDNKIRTLLIIAISLLMAICVIVIYMLVDKTVEETENTPNVTPVVTSEPEEDLPSVPLEDPVGEDGMKIHTSENGYTVKYPSDMVAKTMAKSMDFILEDPNSGSSLNILTAKNDGSVKKFTEEEFENSLAHTSGGSQLLSYEEVVLNGADAVIAEFVYLENYVKQVIIISGSYAYNITMTESSDITDEMRIVFDNVINSFTLN